MEDKYSSEVQDEIDDIIKNIDAWKNLFSIKTEFYFDGFAITLREKKAYPRSIIIFKSYDKNSFSIKSFEILFNNIKEEYKEIYLKENIQSKKELVKELIEVIYGKDQIKFVGSTLKGHSK